MGVVKKEDVGVYLDAGLPNLKGSFSTGGTWEGFGSATGVYSASGSGGYPSGGATGNYKQINFNANKYSSVYRDNIATVQPLTAALMFCIRY